MMTQRTSTLVVEGGERIIDFNHKAFKPIPEEGIAMATDAMRRGVMYRYQPPTKEDRPRRASRRPSPSTWA